MTLSVRICLPVSTSAPAPRGVQQILGNQPFTQLLQLGGKAPSPCAILTKLLVEMKLGTSTPLVLSEYRWSAKADRLIGQYTSLAFDSI